MQPDRFVRAAGGRLLAADSRGRRPGRATVLFCHSAPGSRVLDPDPWSTATAGVRFIAYDRAGYGESTALPAGSVPTIAAAADDAALVAQALGEGPVAAVGWSAGGLVALALAVRHPELVSSVTMIATPAHEDDVSRLDDDQKAMVTALRPNLPGAMAAVEAALAPIARSPRAMLDLLGSGDADDSVRLSDDYGARLETMVTEGIRQGLAGVAADIVASSVAPWGFEPADVTVPVRLWYGGDDELVPPEHGAYWAGALPTAELTTVPGVGHFLPLVAWGRILAAVKAVQPAV